MKIKKLLILLAAFVLCFAALYALFIPKELSKKVLMNLNKDEIESIEIVAALDGHKRDGVILRKEDEEKVLSLIRQIEISRRHDDIGTYENTILRTGGYILGEMFCITMKNGKTLRVGLSSDIDFDKTVYIDFIDYDLTQESIQKCKDLYGYYSYLGKEKYKLDFFYFDFDLSGKYYIP